MGWPKKNEGLRVYLEKKGKSYLLYDPETREGIGEIMINNDPDRPMLASTGVSPMYLYRHCRRVDWNELPDIWKISLGEWLQDKPENYRGLFRINRA